MKDKIAAEIRKYYSHVKISDVAESLIDAIWRELKSAIAKEIEEGQAGYQESLRQIAALLKTTKEKETKLMVAQADLDASLKALSDAVNNAIANIPDGTRASTPDAAVLAFKSGVDTNVAALNAAEAAAQPPKP